MGVSRGETRRALDVINRRCVEDSQQQDAFLTAKQFEANLVCPPPLPVELEAGDDLVLTNTPPSGGSVDRSDSSDSVQFLEVARDLDGNVVAGGGASEDGLSDDIVVGHAGDM